MVLLSRQAAQDFLVIVKQKLFNWTFDTDAQARRFDRAQRKPTYVINYL